MNALQSAWVLREDKVMASATAQTPTIKEPSKRLFKVGNFPGFGVWSILAFIYLYAPLVALVIFSFNANRTVTLWTGFSLDWYKKAFANDQIQDAVWNSVQVGVIATIASTIIATLAALVMVRGKSFKAKGLVTSTLMLPLIIPEIVTAIATLIFFAAILGFLQNLVGHPINPGLATIIIAHTVFCIPFAYLPIQARLQSMDATLEQAARDLYANPWQTFRRVTLPLLMPGVISGALLAFVTSFDDFIITLMVAPAGATTLPIYIYGMVRLGITPEINAVSTVILAASVVIVLIASLVGRRRA
jgi:spermidine/putrescine transport system permease protein